MKNDRQYKISDKVVLIKGHLSQFKTKENIKLGFFGKGHFTASQGVNLFIIITTLNSLL